MCHQSSCPCVMVEEAVPAEECLLVYCKPVELYNILQRRAHRNPSFLPRSLSYKIEARWKAGSLDGNVIFNYRDQNNLLRKTQVTRRFSCPFCLLHCGSFKGLRYHLVTSHELFKCEFWATEEYRAVNISVKTEALHSEDTADEIDPQLQLYSFCSKPRKRKRPEDLLERGRHVYPHVPETRSHLESNESEKDPSTCLNIGEFHNSRIIGENHCYENGKVNSDNGACNGDSGVPVARAHFLEDLESMSLDKSMPSIHVPSAKSRKLSFERSEPRSLTLLQKRQFYHSHRAQPMALEQVLSDKDSEDEVDDDIAALEDRRMLDDFVDVTKHEKHLMHMWNSFVRKQRVLADGHVPWACEAFLRQHGKELVQSPTLFWCCRLLMIKFWNHGLLDACTMNNCSMILQKYKEEDGNCSNTCKPEA